MQTTINMSNAAMDMERFCDRADLKHFYADKGIDGLELILCEGQGIPEKITPSDIIGLHLSFFPSWLDFWTENRQALDAEYGDRQVWQQYYGGTKPVDLLKRWEQELELAHRLRVQYVVFHVSECALEECVTYRFRHSNEQVCRAAAQIINRLLKGKPYTFYFLAENLWWSGLTLTEPQVTRMFLEQIEYEKKGILLDTGHLLHTNRSLATQEEAVDYIRAVLEKNGELCRYIHGVHLHQSLSGAYVERMLASPLALSGDYQERLMQVYSRIFAIDTHKPFTAAGVRELVEQIAPQFLTFELITGSRQEHEEALQQQLAALRKRGEMPG